MNRFKAGAALAAAMMTGVLSAAEAQVLDAMKKSYQCAKQSAIATVELTGEVAKKAALATEIAANASACTAAQGGNPAYYVATTGSISAIKAVSPETIPTGQCHSAVKSTVSRPLLEGVSYLIPSGEIKNQIVSKLNSDLVKEQLWTAVDSIVVVKPFTMQVDCACTTIDNGLAMTDLKAVGESIGRVSSSCAAALDSLGLGFINDLDNKVAEGFEKAYSGLSGGYDELVRGETDPKDPALVYHDYFGKFFDGAVQHGSSKQNGKWLSQANPLYAQNMSDASECASYYDQHKHSLANGKKICAEMESRFVTMVHAKVASNIQTSDALLSASTDIDKWLTTMLAWRIPLPSNQYTLTEFKSKLGALGCSEEDFNFNRLWKCKPTGTYQAVLQARATGADTATSMKVAFAASGPKLGAQILSYWESNKEKIRNFYYAKWYGPAGSETYPCGLASKPYGELCLPQMNLYYDFECHIPMALAAHEGTSTARMNKAINACRSGLDRIRTDAAAIATRAAMPSYAADLTALCQPHTARQDRATCEAIVGESAADCQKEAFSSLSSNKWKDPLAACWANKKTGLSKNLGAMIAVRNGVSVPQTTPAPTGPLVPANPVIDLPKGRGQ